MASFRKPIKSATDHSMARQLRYWGEFLSVEGVRWRVELLQETSGVDLTPEEIFFPASPLTIEWAKCNKLDVIESSSATLIVESDTDRRFIDLYQVEFGTVLLNVYRAGSLYWSGTLDTELYEEPYSYNSHYDVTLTFSDFAPLERLKWQMDGCPSTLTIVKECLKLSCIEFKEIDKRISTALVVRLYKVPLTLDEVFNLCENFYDEDGEPMTVKEVLEAVLKPFALKIQQKNGAIVIYDINRISLLTPSVIEWDSTDATLSVDETFNNVTLAFSPYADTTILSGEIEPEDVAPDEQGILIHTDNNSANNQFLSPEGFRFVASSFWSDILELSGGAKFFRINPQYSGSKEAGVAYTAKTFDQGIGDYNMYDLYQPKDCFNAAGVNSEMMMRTKQRKFINSASEFTGYKLKVSLELLFDVRYNPFETKQINNEEGNWQKMQDWCNFGYVPIKIYIKNDNGEVLYHFENKATLYSDGYEDQSAWVAGPSAWGDCFLAYYDKGDRRGSSGFGGWKKNRTMIGYHQGELPSSFDHGGEGQIIPMPPDSGWLVMEVGTGVHQFDYNRRVEPIYPMVKWVLYKSPEITVIKNNGIEFSPEDIEIKAWINKAAKEELSISTAVGTMPKPIPSARGLILDQYRRPTMKFSRQGVTDTIERLLVGTAYSHYATKHNILSGTAKILPTFGIYNDSNTSGVFMVMSEVQYIADDQSEISLVQIHEDNYTGLEFDE